MFGTTYAGSAAAPEHSALIPALHDEAYTRLGIFSEMFHRVRGVAFYSRAKMALAKRLYLMQPGAAAVIPACVEASGGGDGARFRSRHDIGDYLLYAGRKEIGKNVPLLLEYFLDAVGSDDVVVYHHSIYSDATEAYVQTLARRGRPTPSSA